jgi:Mrp family chromosome partitioning ATPase
MTALFALICAFGLIQIFWLGVSLRTVAVWPMFGLVVAGIVALAREGARNVLGDLASVRRATNMSVGSAAPAINRDLLRSLPPDYRTPMGAAVFFPGSDFAASIRNLASALASSQVVAFLGTGPRDGATSTASATAALASQQGRRTLLVDCDVRRRGLTHMLDLEPAAGFLEAVKRPETWSQLIVSEPETGIEILPAARLNSLWAGALEPGALSRLIGALRGTYDLIVLDCPPSALNADGAMIGRLSDLCVLVAAWDETPSPLIRQTLRRFRGHAAGRLALHVNRAPRDFIEDIADIEDAEPAANGL